MTTPAQVHNALGLVVDLYGSLLKDLADENARLRAQNEALTAALKRGTLSGSHDRQNEGGLPGAVGGGKEPLGGQPLAPGREGASEGGRVLQGDEEVGEVQGSAGQGLKRVPANLPREELTENERIAADVLRTGRLPNGSRLP